jgi:3-oxoacyl-[acyl-carrier-protein] synthase III
MFRSAAYSIGLEIGAGATCDFDKLEPLSNTEVIRQAGREESDRLRAFLSDRIGIHRRYRVRPGTNALDLARDAMAGLLSRDRRIAEQAEFVVFAGISSPMPTTCTAALLADEFGLARASCWDIKSGCSTGVLAMAQALDWFHHGAGAGILVSAETFSRFTPPAALEMAATTGDGACALALRASRRWRVRGVVHGTDARYLKHAYVRGTYPIDPEKYRPEDHRFSFDAKPEALERIAQCWVDSLRQLLALSEIDGDRVTRYVGHQVDAAKNRAFARACGIRDAAIAMSFAELGNMGSPTVFINYLRHVGSVDDFRIGDVLVFHAVGGGISYAGICLERVG